MSYSSQVFVEQKIARLRKTMEKHRTQMEKDRLAMLHEMTMLNAALDDFEETLKTEKEKNASR